MNYSICQKKPRKIPGFLMIFFINSILINYSLFYELLPFLYLQLDLCPICQIKCFGYKNFFYFEDAREEKLEKFSEEVNGLDPIDAIMSPAASELNYDEKMLYIYDMDLDKDLIVDKDTGEVRRIGNSLLK